MALYKLKIQNKDNLIKVVQAIHKFDPLLSIGDIRRRIMENDFVVEYDLFHTDVMEELAGIDRITEFKNLINTLKNLGAVVTIYNEYGEVEQGAYFENRMNMLREIQQETLEDWDRETAEDDDLEQTADISKYNYLWKDEKNDWVLVNIENGYGIVNNRTKMMLLVEDDNLADALIRKMIESGNKKYDSIQEAFGEKNSQQVIEEFLYQFPEFKDYYKEHMDDYGELLQHVFYADVINVPLFDLLKTNTNSDLIKKYVQFIEFMWLHGDESVQNVVDVTILERLSDDRDVWHNLSTYISKDFKDYINNELLPQNCAMWHVESI